MKSVGDMWPFLRKPSKKQLAAQAQRHVLEQRARTAARLRALQDQKNAQQILDQIIVDRMTPEIYDRIIADLAQVTTDGPTYIINEEQELTDV